MVVAPFCAQPCSAQVAGPQKRKIFAVKSCTDLFTGRNLPFMKIIAGASHDLSDIDVGSWRPLLFASMPLEHFLGNAKLQGLSCSHSSTGGCRRCSGKAPALRRRHLSLGTGDKCEKFSSGNHTNDISVTLPDGGLRTITSSI